MTTIVSPDRPDVAFLPETNGSTRAQLTLDNRNVSGCWIVPFTLRIGAAAVRMDGIGGVGTEEDCRNRGYSRLVLEETMKWMSISSDAALSMLYGITDYYPKFGYATAGPDYFLRLLRLDREVTLPAGWTSRSFALGDLPAIRRIYDRATTDSVGAAMRPDDSPIWSKIAASEDGANPDECRVVVDAQGDVRGYAWKGKGFWYVSSVERDEPGAFVLAEAMAADLPAAEALIAVCRLWAKEPVADRDEPYGEVRMGLPPEGPVHAATMFQDAETRACYLSCGGSMARVLNVHRLLTALAPELERRATEAGLPYAGPLVIRTEIGDATLQISPEGIRVQDGNAAGNEGLNVFLPQTALARLALGAFDPKDVLSRLETPIDDQASELLHVLFPQRHPHMHYPDRY